MRLHCDFCGRRFTTALLSLAGLAAAAACRTDEPPPRTFTAVTTPAPERWDQLFDERRELSLRFPASVPPLLRIGSLLPGPAGMMLVADRHRILAFNADGTLARELRGGRDVPVNLVGALTLDRRGNLFVYDPDGDWITELSWPAFRVVHRFQLPHDVGVNDIAPLRDGSIVTYDPASVNGAFKRFDRTGREIGSAHPMRDERLRIFHGRVRGGGMAHDAVGDVFGILPSTFEVVHLDQDLRVRDLLRGPPGDAWAPDSRAFPAQLDPYDYRPAHAAWWDTFRHIGRPFVVAPGVILVTVFTSHGIGQSEDFVNVYRTDGRIVAEGLRVPNDGHVVGAATGRIFIARNARLTQGDSVSHLALSSYRLRDRERTISVGALTP